MEQVLGEISGVEHIYSASRPGLAVLSVQFKVGEHRTDAIVRLYSAIYSNQDWRPAAGFWTALRAGCRCSSGGSGRFTAIHQPTGRSQHGSRQVGRRVVDFIDGELRAGRTLEDAVVRAGAIRAKPIALTALAAMIGALFILDDPIFNGLAVSLIFGIFVSTVLTLLVIPVLYYAYLSGRAAKSGIPRPRNP
jgi:multidrug efflux pump subunit AcrB